jgi:hypothetical protein
MHFKQYITEIYDIDKEKKESEAKRLRLTYKGWGVYENKAGGGWKWDERKHKFVSILTNADYPEKNKE